MDSTSYSTHLIAPHPYYKCYFVKAKNGKCNYHRRYDHIAHNCVTNNNMMLNHINKIVSGPQKTST